MLHPAMGIFCILNNLLHLYRHRAAGFHGSPCRFHLGETFISVESISSHSKKSMSATLLVAGLVLLRHLVADNCDRLSKTSLTE